MFFLSGLPSEARRWRGVLEAYDLVSSHHALRAYLIRGSAGNESELFGIMTTQEQKNTEFPCVFLFLGGVIISFARTFFQRIRTHPATNNLGLMRRGAQMDSRAEEGSGEESARASAFLFLAGGHKKKNSTNGSFSFRKFNFLYTKPSSPSGSTICITTMTHSSDGRLSKCPASILICRDGYSFGL